MMGIKRVWQKWTGGKKGPEKIENAREAKRALAARIRELDGERGAKARRERWGLRRASKFLDGVPMRARKATKKGANRGAFGAPRGPFDDKPMLKPAEMRKMAAERKRGLEYAGA